jgi:hypothetical protein
VQLLQAAVAEVQVLLVVQRPQLIMVLLAVQAQLLHIQVHQQHMLVAVAAVQGHTTQAQVVLAVLHQLVVEEAVQVGQD